jgi:spermidine/putrescine transport system permease protein
MKVSWWSMIRLYTILVYVLMFAPIAVVLILSFNPEQFGSFPMKGFSLKWYVRLAENERIVSCFKNSLILGFVSASMSALIGILSALAFVRYDFRGKHLLNTLLVAPIMIPRVILGLALLLFLRWLQQPKSFFLLLIGHVIITMPFVITVVQARLVGIQKVFEEAAMTLGANAFHTFREITLPLLAPAILAGMLFAFTISFDEVIATLFWSTASTQTVPIEIFGMLRESISPELNALGMVMIILTILIFLLAMYLPKKLAKLGNTHL